MSQKISVFIITKNEADRIKPVITAAKPIADEILVIDSGSTDKTREIAKNCGATVIFNEWQGYGPQKIFGEKSCKNDWILNIDADEIVSEKLANEIKNLTLGDFHGYHIKIVNKFPFDKKPHKFAYFYNQLRLYNRKFGGFKDSTVHDSVQMQNNTKIGQLKHRISHQSFRDISHWIEKLNSYSSMQAEDAFKKGKNPSSLKIALTPIFSFFKAYFIRRYFIYGLNGIIYSKIFALSRLAKMIKIREKFQKS